MNEQSILSVASRVVGGPAHHALPVSPQTVHWGYFSKIVAPALTVRSGDRATIETLTHHANDDYERMIANDPGAESVFHWTREHKAVARRGAGPAEGPFIRGAGEGLGVHLLTGPVAVDGAEPGDILEVRILDVRPRPSCHAGHAGRCFGSNVAANWGFHYHDLIEDPKPREVVTIFELDTSGEPFARAVYNYVWTPQTDPDGIVHAMVDYPGVRVDHGTIRKRDNILESVRVPARLHFGTMGLAPSEQDFVSSIPPGYTGGNIDDWRIGKGARMFYPVAVPGALFSVGDPHAAQGDSELGGTAIETSLTGDFEFILHKKNALEGTALEGLAHPMLETAQAWSFYGFTFPNYLAELGPDAQTEIVNHSSLDRAMRDAFRKLRRFLMTVHKLSEDEAIALMSVAADFGVTQVVDANWGVHGSIRKDLFNREGFATP
jgi:acetamidase/formamidase